MREGVSETSTYYTNISSDLLWGAQYRAASSHFVVLWSTLTNWMQKHREKVRYSLSGPEPNSNNHFLGQSGLVYAKGSNMS